MISARSPDNVDEVHLVVAEVVWVEYDELICNEKGRIDPVRLGSIGRSGLRTFLRSVDESAYNPPRIPWDDDTTENV